MALVDHLREFRYRVIISVVAILVLTVVGWEMYGYLSRLVMWPLHDAVTILKRKKPGFEPKVSYEGLSASLLLKFQVSMVAALIASCPVWLYQLWAFIAPGLYAKEKRWALRFLGASVPLFLVGVTTGYAMLSRAYVFMLDFVPNDADTLALLEANQFLATEMKIVLLFGLSFLLPVILVTLNVIGLVKGDQLRRFRKFGIFLCFVFAAVVTPSTDPFSMTALAVPMAVLYVIAEFICRRHDKRLSLDPDRIVLD